MFLPSTQLLVGEFVELKWMYLLASHFEGFFIYKTSSGENSDALGLKGIHQR